MTHAPARLLERFVRLVLSHARTVLVAWAVLVACAAVLAVRLPSVIHGGTDAIGDSESGRVTAAIDAKFGQGAGFGFAVIVSHREVDASDPEFSIMVNEAAAALQALAQVRRVSHYWNTGAPELLGRSGRSALLLVTPNVASYFAAEDLTNSLREALSGLAADRGYLVTVTGAPAMFYDLTRHSSSDLTRAEHVGIPVALVILLFVFRAPLAALLPLVLAGAAGTVSSAALFLLSRWMPMSIFAQNVVTMIGLGIGVDYALLVVIRFRRERVQGCRTADASLRAAANAAPAILVSGTAVAIGFLALLLVHAPFLHGMAFGGLTVVFATVVASLTLLPVLLQWWGRALNWPWRLHGRPTRGTAIDRMWNRWATQVMAHPWRYLGLAGAMVGILVVPVFWMQSRNVSMGDMPPGFESRRGYELLRQDFVAGWMGPIVVLLQGCAGVDLRGPNARQAVLAVAARLGRDKRVVQIQGYPRLLRALAARDKAAGVVADPQAALPSVGTEWISADGGTALMILVPRAAPEREEMLAFVRQLRGDAWPEARAAGIGIAIGGPAAMIADFDAELFGSLGRIVPAVLAVTFVVLMAAFRSVLIPAKAVLMNLLSVLAAYGFLVLVFQEGIGAALIGIDPPGGLNSLVILMLFTILFGLSMDYEVFLLHQINEAYRRSGENRIAVASGVACSAGLISSAAAIMICLCGSFAFTHLTATREFGLGLAFAVALDATVIRLLMVPALMELFGAANWWWPGWKRHPASKRRFSQACGDTRGVQSVG